MAADGADDSGGGEPSDLALLDRWAAGDQAAGVRLFRRHLREVYRFFATKVDAADVDEVVQETFLACVRQRDRFRRQSSFRTFLFAIARFVLHEHWRRRQRRETPIDFDEISVASLSTSVGGRLSRREDRSRLLEAMRALPVDQQLLLELHYWEGLDGAELAEVFDVEPATIRSRLFRARDALRAGMQGLERRGAAAGADDFDAWARALRPDADDRDGGEAAGGAAAQKVRNGGAGGDATES